jgi:hypothetical protein
MKTTAYCDVAIIVMTTETVRKSKMSATFYQTASLNTERFDLVVKTPASY